MNPHQHQAPRKLLNGVKIQAPEECYEKAPTDMCAEVMMRNSKSKKINSVYTYFDQKFHLNPQT
jgi:hypothetical protein